LNECAKCGACLTVCPVYLATGRESLSARGKQHLLDLLGAEAGQSATSAAIFSACLLCGACYDACPRQVDTPGRISKVRQKMAGSLGKKLFAAVAGKSLSSPTLMRSITQLAKPLHAHILKKLPPDSGLRLRLAPLDLERLPASSTTQDNEYPLKRTSTNTPKIALYTGCFARHLYPEITDATRRLLAVCGLTSTTPAEQNCCGLASYTAGNCKEAHRLAQQNITAFEQNDLPILTTCASCFAHLRSYPELFADNPEWRKRANDFAVRITELSVFMDSNLPADENLFTKPPLPQRLLYHDPCHLRFRHKIIQEPRRILSLLSGTELIELPHDAQCCGQGGFFDLANPSLSRKIRNRLHDDFLCIQVDTVVTSCTGCLIQWRRILSAVGSTAQVTHTALLLAHALKNTRHP